MAQIYYNTIHNYNIKDYSQEQVNAWGPESFKETTRWIPKFEKTNPFVAVVNNTVVAFAEL